MSFYFAQLARNSGVAVRGVVTALPGALLPLASPLPAEGDLTEVVEAVEAVEARPDERPPPVTSAIPAGPPDSLPHGSPPVRDEAEPLHRTVAGMRPDPSGTGDTEVPAARAQPMATAGPAGEARFRLDPVVEYVDRTQDERPTSGEPFDAADLLRRAMQWVAAGSRDSGSSDDASARPIPVTPGWAAADRPPPQEPETRISGSAEFVGSRPPRHEDGPTPTLVAGTPAYLPPRPAEAWSAPDPSGPTAREETVEIRIGRIEVVVEAPESPGPRQPARPARPARNPRPRDPERHADPRRSGLLPN